MNKKSYNPFEVAQKQFDRAADLLELDKASRDLLRNPLREYHQMQFLEDISVFHLVE